MLTSARVEAPKCRDGIEWVSARKGVRIGAVVEDGELQAGRFHHQSLAETVSPRFSAERLTVCKKSDLARERALARDDLLSATERELENEASYGGPTVPLARSSPSERPLNPSRAHAGSSDPSLWKHTDSQSVGM